MPTLFQAAPVSPRSAGRQGSAPKADTHAGVSSKEGENESEAAQRAADVKVAQTGLAPFQEWLELQILVVQLLLQVTAAES